MQVPVEIAFRHCEPSGEIRSEVAKQVRRLEKFSARITSCRVMVTGPETRHRRGGLFEVELRIAMPEHNDIVVDKSHGDAPQREHALVAIRDAFDAAGQSSHPKDRPRVRRRGEQWSRKLPTMSAARVRGRRGRIFGRLWRGATGRATRPAECCVSPRRSSRRRCEHGRPA